MRLKDLYTMEDRKKIKVDIDIEFTKQFLYSKTDPGIRIKFFLGNDLYFSFYYGLFKKRAIKRNTWIYELLYHRDEFEEKSDSGYVIKPIRILKSVSREKGRYKYKETLVSAYLVRRIFEESYSPESFNDLEIIDAS